LAEASVGVTVSFYVNQTYINFKVANDTTLAQERVSAPLDQPGRACNKELLTDRRSLR